MRFRFAASTTATSTTRRPVGGGTTRPVRGSATTSRPAVRSRCLELTFGTLGSGKAAGGVGRRVGDGCAGKGKKECSCEFHLDDMLFELLQFAAE